MEVHLNFQLFQQGTEDLSEWLCVTLLKAIVAKWFEPKGRAVIKGRGPEIFPGYLMNLTPTYFYRKIEEK